MRYYLSDVSYDRIIFMAETPDFSTLLSYFVGFLEEQPVPPFPPALLNKLLNRFIFSLELEYEVTF